MDETIGQRGSVKLTHWSTDAITDRDRFGAWQELLGKLLLPLKPEPLGDSEIRASFSNGKNSIISATWVSMTPQRIRRGIQEIGRGGEYVGLLMPLNCSCTLVSDGSRRAVNSGELMVLDPSTQACTEFFDHPACEVLFWRVARAPLEEQLRTGSTRHRVLPCDQGPASLVAMYMRNLTRRLVDFDAVTQDLMNRQFTSLLALALGISPHFAEAGHESVQEAQWHRILGYISRHLGDPELSAQHAAQKLGISARKIHRIFEHRGITFSAWVMEQRLRKAHQLLTTSSCERGIADVAFGCGFNGLSTFYRAFRAAYGVAPRDLQAPARDKGAEVSDVAVFHMAASPGAERGTARPAAL